MINDPHLKSGSPKGVGISTVARDPYNIPYYSLYPCVSTSYTPSPIPTPLGFANNRPCNEVGNQKRAVLWTVFVPGKPETSSLKSNK